MLVADGELLVNDIYARKGDGIAISNEDTVALKAKAQVELLIIEVPGISDAR